jgi:hypothetical protein
MERFRLNREAIAEGFLLVPKELARMAKCGVSNIAYDVVIKRQVHDRATGRVMSMAHESRRKSETAVPPASDSLAARPAQSALSTRTTTVARAIPFIAPPSGPFAPHAAHPDDGNRRAVCAFRRGRWFRRPATCGAARPVAALATGPGSGNSRLGRSVLAARLCAYERQ